MDVEAPDRFVFDNTLVIGPRGHVYVEVCWPGVSGRACWDTGPVIGERTFSRHKAVAVDLSPVNRTVDIPMDMILGYPDHPPRPTGSLTSRPDDGR
jgi:hypothetical protein